ncbi:MAG: hypothetical protein WCQ82_02880 [Bacteroidaceae bacterium]|nr:hypothetical protein [Bacteroidaceae bacterium]
MKKTFLAVATLSAILALSGCHSTTKKQKEETIVSTPSQPYSSALLVDDVLSKTDAFIDKIIYIKGTVAHICSHGGTKIFLMGSNDQHVIRVEAGTLGSFPKEVANHYIYLKGRFKETRIDEAYLQNWEKTIAQQTEDKHGDEESGCASEKAARKEKGNTSIDRITDFRKRIAAEKLKTGKNYLSFYYLVAEQYEQEK